VYVQVFMGGKHLPTTAWLVFFAVVDELSGAGAGRPELWAFLRDQCLACIKSTRDFSDIGDRVPLLEAMVRGVVWNFFPSVPCHCRDMCVGPAARKLNSALEGGIVRALVLCSIIPKHTARIQRICLSVVLEGVVRLCVD
jgi:hypothetical protein